MASHENEMAKILRNGIRELGYSFYSDSPTNQLFPILPNGVIDKLEQEDHEAVVVEYSVFKNREIGFMNNADVVIAILAKLDTRIERAVAAGWDEDDVRRRIARQITDAARIEEADVVFNNDGTPEELRNEVTLWWHDYKARGFKLG